MDLLLRSSPTSPAYTGNNCRAVTRLLQLGAISPAKMFASPEKEDCFYTCNIRPQSSLWRTSPQIPFCPGTSALALLQSWLSHVLCVSVGRPRAPSPEPRGGCWPRVSYQKHSLTSHLAENPFPPRAPAPPSRSRLLTHAQQPARPLLQAAGVGGRSGRSSGPNASTEASLEAFADVCPACS